MPRGVKNSNDVKRNTFKEVPCIIGIDQSYTRTGITISINGKIKKIKSINFKGIKSKTMKRLELQRVLQNAIDVCLKKYTPDQITIIAERIRTYTASNDLRPAVIKAHSALMAYIVDTAYINGIRVYSVDTRAWKTRVLGTSQPVFEPIEGVKNPQKFGSVRKVIDLGFQEEITIRNPKQGNAFKSYDDDAADSACISLYGFSGFPYALQLEQ